MKQRNPILKSKYDSIHKTKTQRRLIKNVDQKSHIILNKNDFILEIQIWDSNSRLEKIWRWLRLLKFWIGQHSTFGLSCYYDQRPVHVRITRFHRSTFKLSIFFHMPFLFHYNSFSFKFKCFIHSTSPSNFTKLIKILKKKKKNLLHLPSLCSFFEVTCSLMTFCS